MKPLDVDLRSRSVPPRWAWRLLTAFAVAAAVVGVAAALSHQRLATLLIQEEAQEAIRLHQSASAPAALAAVPSIPPAYDAHARAALAQAQAQWPALLTALESVEIAGVTPIAIDISSSERSMRVELEFTRFADVLQYLDALNAGEATPRWQLVQAQNDPRTPATAAIRAGW